MMPWKVLNEIPIKYNTAYHFNGNERHAYRNRLTKTRSLSKGTRYQLEFKTNSQNGLMFYRANSGKDAPLSRDYVALALSKGRLQLAYVCGGDLADDVRYLQSQVLVNDSKWHKVTIRQRKNSIQLKLNRERDIKARCKRPQHGLKPNTKLWLGGAPKNSMLYSTLVTDEYLIGFKGCIRTFSVNNQILDLSRTAPGSSSRSLQLCQHG
ncbi:pikachurin-like [Ctenocephalides felis]|uniref:pikachurin-like n=1 Tax=Ctenocephalides felis TaxID=7515 RepID=UPI000E6E2C9E|nr:pikachurin-like [Ctenocephalides felis]